MSRDDRPRSGGALAPLKHRLFRRVWTATIASHFGAVVQSVGASWMMTQLTPSAQMVALVQSSVTLPIMLLSLLAGALADSLDRRRLMLGAQLFMLLVSLLLAAFAFMGLLGAWGLLAFTFLIGCGMAFNGPAWQASVGDMVPRPDLPSAVALNSMAYNIARSVGPAVGGAIVAAAGAASAFALNALSYFGLVFVLLRWKPAPPGSALPRERVTSAIAGGLRFVSLSPAIRIVLVRSALFGVGASAVPALMPLIARDAIGGGPLVYGLLLGAFGGGAVSGVLLSGRIRDRLTTEGLVRIACLVFAGSAALLGLVAGLAPAMLLLAFAGAAWVLALSTFNVAVQLNAPRWVVARALSIYQMATFGGMALGAWSWGWTADHLGIAWALAGGAVLLVACALLGFVLALPRLGARNLEPRGWSPPDPAIDVRRSGPVVVMIEFRIAEKDVGHFLAAMARRRRVRRRAGARRWTLLRDAADPQAWIERFHVASWTEYLRHSARLTQADMAALASVRALHQGEGPPRVRRLVERPPVSTPLPDLLHSAVAVTATDPQIG